MKKLILISFLIALILCMMAGASSIDLNASDAFTSVSSNWVTDGYYNQAYLIDDNWDTASHSQGFYSVWLEYSWNYSAYGMPDNATFTFQTDSNGLIPPQSPEYHPVNLPSYCLNAGMAEIRYSFSPWTWLLECYDGASWQNFYSTSANSGVYYEGKLTLNYNMSSPSALGCPSAIMPFYDPMNYTGTYEQCGYQMIPHDSILAPNGGLFFPSANTELYRPLSSASYYNANYDSYDAYFLATAGNADCPGVGYLEDSGYLEHQLIYYDGTSSIKIPVYDVTFFYDTNSHQVSGYSLSPENTLNTFCSNCFSPYYSAKIEIYSFNHEQPLETFLNSTSNTIQRYNPNSFSVFVDGLPIAYNLPMPNPLTSGHSNLIAESDYYMSRCVITSNFQINGLLAASSNPLKLNGDYCSASSECESGLCQYGKCAGKGGGISCNVNSECLSNSCENSICTSSGWWSLIDTSAKSQFGKSSMDLSLLAILITLVVAAGIILITKGEVWGMMISAGFALIGLFFFTMAGWLSAFIFIAVILTLLVGILLFFIISQRGN